MKAEEAQSRAVAVHGELALITVDTPQVSTNERVSLRSPMLQVTLSRFLTLFVVKNKKTLINNCSVWLNINKSELVSGRSNSLLETALMKSDKWIHSSC